MGEIVVAGAGILDVLVHPVSEKVFTSGSEPMDDIRIEIGGDALNEARILARLGAAPDLVTLLGEDEAGTLIKFRCEKEGISLAFTKSTKEIETGINVVLVKADGSRSFLTNPESTLRKLSPAHMPEHFPKEAKIFCLASMFVSPLLGNAKMAELFKRAKDAGLTVCADMTKCKNGETAEEMSDSLSLLDVLFANEEEAKLLTGEGSPEAAARALFHAGAKNVVVKCGKDGCLIRNRDGQERFPAVSGTPCVDTTGAGDAFAAGFLFGLSKGWDPAACAEFANACGSLAVQDVGGCGILTDERQVLELLSRQKSGKDTKEA